MENQLPITQANLPNRAIHALEKDGKFQTIDQLEKVDDETLMKVPRLGRKSIDEIRARIAEIKGVDKPPKVAADGDPDMEWARTHKNIIRAIRHDEIQLRVRR